MIHHGVMNILAPNLQDDELKAVAGMLERALKELYKREQRTSNILRDSNAAGMRLANDMRSLADEVAVGGEQNDALSKALEALGAMDTHNSFGELRDVNNRLNAAITSYMDYLSSLRGVMSDDVQERISQLMRAGADWDYDYSVAQREAIEFEAFELAATKGGEDINVDNLKQFLSGHYPDEEIEIADFKKIPGGMGKHTYGFTLRRREHGDKHLIVRKADTSPVLTRAACVIDGEFKLLKAVYDAGFNVPEPLFLSHDNPVFDADFFVMTKSEGVVPGNFFGPTMELSEALLKDVAANMAKLHSIDIEAFADYFRDHLSMDIISGDIKNAYRIELEYWKSEYANERGIARSPVNAYTWDWLLHNIPNNKARPVLVHGDFNIHNFLVDGDKISAVLDWELAIAGDPAQDLAYIKPNIDRYIDWRVFMQAYYDNGGREIDESTFGYYIAFANARPMIGSLHNLYLMDKGKSDDVRIPYMDTDFLPQFIGNILEHAK